jgi:hypothetical protein
LKSFEFLVFGFFIGLNFFTCSCPSVFEFLKAIYEETESGNPGFYRAKLTLASLLNDLGSFLFGL